MGDNESTYDQSSDQVRYGPTRLSEPRNRYLLLAFGVILLATILILAFSHNTALFPVTVNGKIGYINSAGKVIIQPQFNNAGRFEEGMAPVLSGRTWGYID